MARGPDQPNGVSSGPTVTAGRVAESVGGRVEGDPDAPITGVSGLRGARPGDLSFVSDRKYARLAAGSAATAVLVPEGLELPGGCPAAIRVADLTEALDRVTQLFRPPEPPGVPGVHPAAVLGEDVELGENVSVGACAVIEPGTRVGGGSVIGAQVYVGHGAVIGADTRLFPGVHVGRRCRVGSRCILHPGVVIGSDGFGYVFHGGRHQKVPQIGVVVIEDDVEIGSNTTIDRARFGATRVGRGTKIDNLVMIAHNVQIGQHCVITGQVGIAGSASIGDYVLLGARTGIVGHVHVADGAHVAAGAGITKDLAPGARVKGIPAEPVGQVNRRMAAARKLPGLLQRVRDLEGRVDALETEPES